MQENNREFSFLKQKILIYIDYKQISKYEVYTKTGITNGVLSQTNGISEENILKFLNYYTDISLDWLFLDKGNMLIDENRAPGHKNEDDEPKTKDNDELEELKNTVNELQLLIDAQKQIIETQKETIETQKETIETQKDFIKTLKSQSKIQNVSVQKSTNSD